MKFFKWFTLIFWILVITIPLAGCYVSVAISLDSIKLAHSVCELHKDLWYINTDSSEVIAYCKDGESFKFTAKQVKSVSESQQ